MAHHFRGIRVGVLGCLAVTGCLVEPTEQVAVAQTTAEPEEETRPGAALAPVPGGKGLGPLPPSMNQTPALRPVETVGTESERLKPPPVLPEAQSVNSAPNPVNPSPVVTETRPMVDCKPYEALAAPPEEVAHILAQLLWRGEPDAELLAAVEAGELSSPEQLKRQIQRMIRLPAALDHLAGFAAWWLGRQADPARRLELIVERLQYSPERAQALLTSIEEGTRLFMRDLLSDSSSTLKDFLTSPKAFVTPATALLYGIDVPPQAEDLTPEQVVLPAERHGGILTQLEFLSGRTYFLTRGYFLLDRLFCKLIRPPPGQSTPESPLMAMSSREWWEEYYGSGGCGGCHAAGPVMGYSFDNFDPQGRHRTEMQGMPRDNELFYPVDTRIEFTGPGFGGPDRDAMEVFQAAPEMLAAIASREDVRECFAGHWLSYLMGGVPEEGDAYVRRSRMAHDYYFNPDSLAGIISARTACSPKGGQTNLSDLILQLVNSRLLMEHAFPCGARLCLSDREFCFERVTEEGEHRMSCFPGNADGKFHSCEKKEVRTGAVHVDCR